MTHAPGHGYDFSEVDPRLEDIYDNISSKRGTALDLTSALAGMPGFVSTNQANPAVAGAVETAWGTVSPALRTAAGAVGGAAQRVWESGNRPHRDAEAQRLADISSAFGGPVQGGGVPTGYTEENFGRINQPDRTGYTEENFARPLWGATGEPAVTYAGGGGVPPGYGAGNFDRAMREAMGEPVVTYAGEPSPSGYTAENFDRAMQDAMTNVQLVDSTPRVTYDTEPPALDWLKHLSDMKKSDPDEFKRIETVGKRIAEAEAGVPTGSADALVASGDYAWDEGSLVKTDKDVFTTVTGEDTKDKTVDPLAGQKAACAAAGGVWGLNGCEMPSTTSAPNPNDALMQECVLGGGTWGPNGCTYPSGEVVPQAVLTPMQECVNSGGTWGPNGCTYPTAPIPPWTPASGNFYEPIDLGAPIRGILGEPSTPDYSQEIRDLYAEMEQSVRDRSTERTRVLDESVLRREGQIADIAEALVAELGPMEAARVLEQQGITADVLARGTALTEAAATRQEQTRGMLGPQVTDEYEQTADLVSGLLGSQATSSADLMSRLQSVAGMASAQREATPGMMEADSLDALSDEEFRLANQIATDLANELGELDPAKASALLKEKMRQGEFQTDEDIRIATALMADLERRTLTVEQQWETARQETREERLLKDAREREDERNLELDALKREEIAGDAAAVQAEQAAAATIIGQLKNAGFADEIIGIGQQGAGQANWFDLENRDEALKAWLDQLQQTTVGGPKPMTQFERAQIEAAVHMIWDAQQGASGTYFSQIEETFPGLMGGMDNPDWDRGEDYSIKPAA